MIATPNPSEGSPYIQALIAAGADLYEVGGPVRDRLMGRTSKDRDLLCRKLSPETIVKTLRPFGKVATVGKSFGVIKFTPRHEPAFEIDIALPRREHSTGVGHRDFDVCFDPELSVEEDLGRRDFTINAMALRLADGTIIDPHGGRKDLADGVLRQVFDRAFEEDPLRLVRAIQFTARFGLTIEASTWEAMQRHAPLIGTVSSERISMELTKLMQAPKPSVGFTLMRDCGLLEGILPELSALVGIEQDKQPGDDVFAHTMRVLDAARSDEAIEGRGNLELVFAALLHDIGKKRTARYHAPSKRVVFFGHQIVSQRLARRWMERMKLTSSGIDTKEILTLIEHHMFETKAHYTDRAIRRFVAKIGPERIEKLIDLRIADNRGGKHPNGIKGVLRLRRRIREEMAKKPPFGPKDLAVNGSDLMELGLAEGPAIGIVLHALVECVLDEPERNTRDELLALARQLSETPEVHRAIASRPARGKTTGETPAHAETAESQESRTPRPQS